MLTVFLVLNVIFMLFMVMPEGLTDTLTMGKPPEVENAIINEFRLNETLFVQYVDFIRDSLVGDFRITTSHQVLPGTDIEGLIWSRAAATVLLFTVTLVVSMTAALGLEYIASSSRRRIRSWTIHAIAVIAFSAPATWYSICMIKFVLGAGLDIPTGGNGFDAVSSDGVLGLPTVLSHLALPLTAAFLASFGLFVVVFRWADRRRLERGTLDSGGGFRKWCASVLHELTGARPFIYFLTAWTFCITLMVDAVYGYGGLGGLVPWMFGTGFDLGLAMASMFVSSLFVLVAGMTLNTAINLASRRSLTAALSDWIQRDETLGGTAMVGGHKGVTPLQWIRSIGGSCARNWAFMAAAIALLAMVALAVLAPVLTPQEWSPYIEPDSMIYNGTIDGARSAIIIAAVLTLGAVSIGAGVGMASFYFPLSNGFPGFLRDLFDFVLTALARSYVIIPIILLSIAWRLSVHSLTSTILLVLLALYSWAWILTCRSVRATARTSGQRVRFGRALPSVLAESLSIAKFVVPIAFLVEMFIGSFYVGLGSGAYDVSWYALFLKFISRYGVFTGDWYLAYIPIAAIVLVCASLFVALDRAEHILRTSQIYPERRPAVVSEEATPGS